MLVKTYKTERGAKAFAKRIRERYPRQSTQVCCDVGLDFRNKWYVEIFLDNVRGKPAWVPVGSF